jgi:thioredoxin reductase
VPTQRYDLVIIGAGAGGLTAADFAASGMASRGTMNG